MFGKEFVKIELVGDTYDDAYYAAKKYCEEQNLDPRIDKTNFESIYNRNKIRNEIIPYLKKEFNPNVLEGINRLSNIAREEGSLSISIDSISAGLR